MPANIVILNAGIKFEQKKDEKLSKKQLRYKKIDEVEAYLKEKKLEKEEKEIKD